MLRDPQLARLNFGIFALHAVLMALFIAVPFALRDAGLPLVEHWQVYLPVMLGSFVLMLPAMLGRSGARQLKAVLHRLGGVAPRRARRAAVAPRQRRRARVFLLLFFTPFNVLEAMLPSLTSRWRRAQSKGVAIGVYSSVQFFGTFVGAAAGGFLYGRFGLEGVVIVNAALLVIWLMAAAGMRAPARRARVAMRCRRSMRSRRSGSSRSCARCPACAKRASTPGRARRTSKWTAPALTNTMCFIQLQDKES